MKKVLNLDEWIINAGHMGIRSEYSIILGIIAIGGLFLIPNVTQDAFAGVDVDWTLGFGAPADLAADPGVVISEGNYASGSPLSLQVVLDAIGGDDTTGLTGGVDTIVVTLTSVSDPTGTTIILTETGPATNTFVGDPANTDLPTIVFAQSGFSVPDPISITDTLIVTIDGAPASPECTDGIISTIDGPGGADSVFAYSTTEVDNGVFGIALTMVETGVDTCTFSDRVTFSTVASDEPNGVLLVSPGDVLSFDDEGGLFGSEVTNAVIAGSQDGNAGVFATIGLDQVTATFVGPANTGFEALDLTADTAGGRGGGGLVRPSLVVDSPSGSPDSGGSGCSGDCIPPTLGVDQKGLRHVHNGFSYNDNPVNVELFYTPYPLITAEVGKENKVVFKIFENGGTQNFEHIGFAFGMRSGDVIADSKAVINFDRTFDGRESVTKDDPENALGNIRAFSQTGSCSPGSSTQCTIVTIFHTFREPLEFNIVGTTVWDANGNAWENYYNHGIEVVGDSLNPPKTTMVAFDQKDMRGLYKLVQVDKFEDTWKDEFGNIYEHKGNNNFAKIVSIKEPIKYDRNTMHGCNRECNWFDSYKLNQEMIANQKMIEVLSVESIQNEISGHYTININPLDRDENVELQNSILNEKLRAEMLYEQLFSKEHHP